MNKKISLIFMASVIIILIGFFAYTQIEKIGKVPVSIHVVPDTTQVFINDKAISASSVYLTPGKYSVKGTNDGFISETQEITILDAQNQKIILGLQPDSDEAQEWARENQDKYLEIEGLIGEQVELESQAITEKNPILGVLPYQNYLFSIGYKLDPTDTTGQTYIITVRAPEVYRDAAIQQIKNLGYNPAEYKIEFIDYRNPFND